MEKIKHPIVIVGCGPGAPEYVAPVARGIAVKAGVLVGAPHLLALFPESNAERIAVTADIDRNLDDIETRGRTASVAVLVTGDPGLCSLASKVLRRFGTQNCRVVPGISSFQAAFAGIGEDWLDARIIAAHGRDPDVEPGALRKENKIAVFAGRPQALVWARALAQALGERWRLYLCEELTLPCEKIRQVAPEELTGGGVSTRAIVLFIKDKSAPEESEGRRSEGGADMKTGTFYGIGVGPGDPELITVKGAKLLSRLQHVFVPKTKAASESAALAIVRPYLGSSTCVHETIFPMTADPVDLVRHWSENARALADVLSTGDDAGFITLGDPFLYSTYIYLVRELRKLMPGVPITSVPGVTSFSAAASLAEFPVGEGKAPITIIPAADNLEDFEKALNSAGISNGTVVLMKIGQRLEKILEVLEGMGLIEHGILVSRAGMTGERIVTDLRSLKGANPVTGYFSVLLVHAGGRRRA